VGEDESAGSGGWSSSEASVSEASVSEGAK
jgi:hypothetical protein